MPHTPQSEMQIDEFGRLPVGLRGARQAVRHRGPQHAALSVGQADVRGRNGQDARSNRSRPIKWLLDVIAQPEDAVKHKVFRIENIEVLDMLGLKRREGFRYAIDEFSGRIDELERQAELASTLEPGQAERLSKEAAGAGQEAAARIGCWRSRSSRRKSSGPEHAAKDWKAAMRQLDAPVADAAAAGRSARHGRWRVGIVCRRLARRALQEPTCCTSSPTRP